nr:hypothetical protein [uncultured bacterium]
MSTPADLVRLITVLAEASGTTPEFMRNRLRSMPLDELAALVSKLPPNIKAGLANLPSLAAHLGPGKWTPSPGPQTMAYESEADVLGYGGEPGGGKSQLGLGLAFTKHKRSFVMRRQYGDLAALIEDALKIHGSRDGFNASPPPRLRLDEERVIYFRAAHLVGDEQGTMGQARDLLFLDEATQFAESQVRFLMGWVRSEDPNQRCRTVLATNPPLSAEGLWFVRMFAPWLDPGFRNPAKPGELRWVVTDAEGRDEWVNGPDDVRVIGGKLVKPTSRTFIPAKLTDNPYLVRTGYQQTLDAMPEPFRSLLLGGFRTQFKDQENQVIPTAWVKAAMARWQPDGWKKYEMTAMALDPAGGGDDPAALAMRHGPWYGPLVTLKGEQTRDGAQMAAQVLVHRRSNAALVVDMGGGYGTDVSSRLNENGIPFVAFNGANASSGTSAGGLKFYNARAEAWWKFREELNPDREGGSEIALPDDPELLADLTAPTFEVRTSGILIESKEQIRKRLGRSTNKGDAVVMAMQPGSKAVERQLRASRPPPKVVLSPGAVAQLGVGVSAGNRAMSPWKRRQGGNRPARSIFDGEGE